MRFLVDAQLPRRLAVWLRDQGHDAIHTLDLPRGNRSSDAEVVQIGDAAERIVVTKDADFVNSFQLRGQPARLLLVSTGNISNAELAKLWAANLPAIMRAFDNARFVELIHDKLVIHV